MFLVLTYFEFLPLSQILMKRLAQEVNRICTARNAASISATDLEEALDLILSEKDDD